ncbi:MAG TPA: sigma 54-interacting transcriptional regulator [Gemmataceae bacterium]|nr:sigma 54-interacting transcriptional regulator [Gemmataceae bacterium]
MTEPTVPPSGDASQAASTERTFRWQAFFRRSAEPLFVLDRRQRLLFVNAAWEAATGIPSSDISLLVCRRLRPVSPDDSLQAVVEHALTPPPEARQGTTTRVRRLLPGRDGRRWWDVDFFPLRHVGKRKGALILGRIAPATVEEAAAAAPLSERLVALREQRAHRYGPDLLCGAGPAMRRLAEQARLAVQTTAPVLLLGEPGVGKQTLARFIHYQGPARERPFVAVDCVSLPASAWAEILFGAL